MQRPSLHAHNSFSPTASRLLTTEAHKHSFTWDLNFTCEDLHVPTFTLKFRCSLASFYGRCLRLASPAQRPRLWILSSKDLYFFSSFTVWRLIRNSRASISARPDRAHTHTASVGISLLRGRYWKAWCPFPMQSCCDQSLFSWRLSKAQCLTASIFMDSGDVTSVATYYKTSIYVPALKVIDWSETLRLVHLYKNLLTETKKENWKKTRNEKALRKHWGSDRNISDCTYEQSWPGWYS